MGKKFSLYQWIMRNPRVSEKNVKIALTLHFEIVYEWWSGRICEHLIVHVAGIAQGFFAKQGIRCVCICNTNLWRCIISFLLPSKIPYIASSTPLYKKSKKLVYVRASITSCVSAVFTRNDPYKDENIEVVLEKVWNDRNSWIILLERLFHEA